MIRSIWIERVILLLFGAILFFFVLSLAISITINSDWLYYIFIKLEHLDKKVFLTSNELWHEYKTILHYLNFPWIETLHTKLPLSVSAMYHFGDVKRLFEFNYIVLLITSIMIGIMWRRIFTKTEWWNLLNLFKVSNIIILILVCIVCLDFSNAFIVFHQLLFNNRDWIFNPANTPIIKALPELFFETCFIEIVVIFELVMYTFNWFLKNRLRRE